MDHSGCASLWPHFGVPAFRANRQTEPHAHKSVPLAPSVEPSAELKQPFCCATPTTIMLLRVREGEHTLREQHERFREFGRAGAPTERPSGTTKDITRPRPSAGRIRAPKGLKTAETLVGIPSHHRVHSGKSFTELVFGGAKMVERKYFWFWGENGAAASGISLWKENGHQRPG